MNAIFLTSYGSEGYGHISRCQAISAALDEYKIKNKFIVNTKDRKKILPSNKILSKFNWYKFKKRTLKIIKKYDLVIVDSLLIKKKYLQTLKKNCKFLVYINDYHRWKIDEVLHVDWTLFSKKNINKTELNSYIYTPLRKEFWSKSKFKVKKKIKKILVFFGGGDIHNLSDRFIKIMPELYKNYHLTVISKKKKKLKNVKFLKFMKAKELKKNILNCDLVITSGGQTLYELACIGCPALVVSDTKYDIEDINAWKKKGTIIYLGKWNRIKFNDNFKKKFKKIKFYSVRKKFSENGRELIDGKGALRLAKKIIENVKYNFKK